MEYLPWILFILSFIALIAVSVRLYYVRRAADDILEGFSESISEDTNNLITVSCRDRHMRKLASEINVQLRLLRVQRLRCIQGDTELKDAITSVSHDIRTPLTALCGYLDLLEKEELEPEARRCTQMIRNRTEALKQLTEELFKYSVVVSSDSDEKKTVCLNNLLEDNLASFYALFKKNNITPVIDIPEEKIYRTLGESSLSRIFENIISNAVKYSEGDFEIRMDTTGSIVFSNNTSALTSVTVGRLFDRFYTVETGRNSTGLGLSIAKVLTERMGGTLSAEYVSEKLVITLSLPE